MRKNLKLNTFIFLIIGVVLLGTIFQSLAMWKTGGVYSYGYGYWGPLARDGVWHESLVSALKNKIPPDNPGLSGSRLFNYHYLYDLLVTFTSNLTRMGDRFLIYRFYPVVFSLLLGLLTYLFASKLFKSRLAIFVSVFLVYFGSSFGWIIDIARRREIGGESAFWSSQPVSMNLNPPFAMSLVLVLLILLSLNSYFIKPQKKLALILIFLSGILIGIKVYAGVIVITALIILGIKRYLRNNLSGILAISAAAAFVSAIIYLPQVTGAAGLTFEPFWLVNSMIDLHDRVGWQKLSLARVNYQASGNYIKFILVVALSLGIFVAGNLGTRLVGLISIKQSLKKGDIWLFIFVASLVSLLLPLLFVQSGNPWNVIQFLYYFLFFACFFTSLALSKLQNRLPRTIFLPLFVLFLVLTPISSLATFRSSLYLNPTGYLPTGEISALEFLSKQPYGVVLKYPYDKYKKNELSDPYPLFAYADNAYVSAFSKKPVYIEDEEQQIILGTPYWDRVNNTRLFFKEKNINVANEFLNNSGINYIYLPKTYSLPIEEQQYNMQKIFENKEVNIYRVLQ